MICRYQVEVKRGRNLHEPCVRLLAIDDTSSLIDLHELIQLAVGFDRDRAFSFYTATSSSPWAVKHLISYGDNWEENLEAFNRTKLRDIFPLQRKNLYYLYDFDEDWIFEICKMPQEHADLRLSGRHVLERTGPDPDQYK